MIQDIKTLKRLTFLLFFIIILLGFSHLLDRFQPKEHVDTETYVIDSPVSQIAAIAIKNDSGVISLYLSDQNLSVMQDNDVVSVSHVAAQSMYYELCHLPAKRQFANDELSIDFAQPLAQIIYMDALGEKMRYDVAGVRGPFEEYYLRGQEDDTIYLIAPEIGQYFEMNALGLADKSVLPGLTAEVIPLISEVEIKDFSNQNSYKIVCSNEGELLLYSFDTPINNRIEANIVWEQLFVPLSRVYGEEAVPLEAVIPDPDYQITVKVDGKAYRFFVKNTLENTLIYRENERIAFTISQEKMDFLHQHYESFLMGKAFAVSPGYLERVTMQMRDQEYSFEIGESEKGVTITNQNKTFLYADQKAEYQVLFEIPIQSPITPVDRTAQTPLLTMRYYYKNGVIDEVTLYETENENQFAVAHNGVSYFSTFLSTVEKLNRIKP